MKANPHKIRVVAIGLLMALLLACTQQEKVHHRIEPAQIEHIANSELSKLRLTERAIERLGIQTDSLGEEVSDQSTAAPQLVLPYSSLLYDVQGRTWVYTNPEPFTYIRHEVKVDFIRDDVVKLKEGPPLGTQIVTVGAAELYGTEYEVGH